MKSNYKRLGDYIREVNVRNTSLEDVKLLGVSIQKVFIPSIANTIGTNMSTYKLIKKGHFAYGPVTSRNGDKISVALLNEHEKAMISQAYTSFEVIDTNQLMPEYLMMWFRRPEFDRYARYMSHGSAREIFGWEEMCNTYLPVPSITKQQEIVEEYEALVDRINLNTKLVQKLEDTAQTIYKQWFIDFEFPDENRKSYKRLGQEMVFNEDLNMKIPLGWSVLPVYDTAKFINGASFKEEDFSIEKKGLPIIKIAELKKGISPDTSFTTKEKDLKFKIKNGDMLYSWSGNPETSLEVFKWFGGEAWLNQHIFKLDFKDKQTELFVYFLLKYLKPVFIHIAEGKQTTGLGHVTVADLKKLMICFPSKQVLNNFEKVISPIYEYDSLLRIQNKKLSNFKEVLMSKLATTGDNL